MVRFPTRCATVTLSNVDRELLDQCFSGSELAWRMFCDRYLGLVVQVVAHTMQSLGGPQDGSRRDALVVETFNALLEKDFAALRRFRGESSLGTYVAVVSRRYLVKRLQQRAA